MAEKKNEKNQEDCTGKMNVVGWFEVPVTDMTRAKKFYQAVFNTEFENMDMNGMHLALFPMLHHAGGAAGALVQGGDYKPSTDGTVVYFMTDSIETSLKKIEQNGGKTLLPKMSIGEHGFIAHFKDSEGNKIALHSMK